MLFENYAAIGRGNTLTYLEGGDVKWTVKLDALFAKDEIARFRRSVSSVWWYRTWWVDEPRGKVVMVSKLRQIREADLATGKVTTPKPGVLMAAISLPHARKEALEIAAELKLKEALLIARPVANDPKAPIDVRLRAAVAVQAAGGPRVERELFVAALDEKQALKDREFALRAIRNSLGKGGLDLLEKAARQRATAWAASHAIAEYPDEGAKVLGRIITGAGSAQTTRQYAALALTRMPGAPIAGVIRKSFKNASADAADALLYAALNRGVKNLSQLVYEHEKTLIRVLNKNTGRTAWIARHFQNNPSTDAVKPLLRAAKANANDRRTKRAILDALRACTGLDFGNDIAAWDKGLKGR